MMEHITTGSRLSFNGDLCTVRYAGEVQGTKGQWFGVEWDDPTRGKHSGDHQGVKYFACKSNHPTAGSFVRPSRPTDKARSFLQAAHDKYVSELQNLNNSKHADLSSLADAAASKPIVISGKVVEEVGFEKISKQLAELQQLRIILLDSMTIQGVLATNVPSQGGYEKELERIGETCPKIVELDLSRNPLRSWREVTDICRQLRDIRILKLNGNRFDEFDKSLSFSGVSELFLNETLIDWEEVIALTSCFPSLTSLSLSSNQFTTISAPISHTIKELTLEDNHFTSIYALRQLTHLPNLARLSLRRNEIGNIYPEERAERTDFSFPPTLTSLDISFNKIESWSFVDTLPSVIPSLTSLRISDNPLYDKPPAPSRVTNLPEYQMTVDEAYMLTLARLPSLKIMNYSTITPNERTNGELYYLSLIGKELSAYPQSAEQRILASHPRYGELCDIYGTPDITRAVAVGHGKVDPRSLAARLIAITFYMPNTTSQASSPSSDQGDAAPMPVEHRKEIPRSFDVYRIKANVSRLFSIPPLRFRLIWETEEWDPADETATGDDEWDSSEEEEEDDDVNDEQGSIVSGPHDKARKEEDGKRFVRREEELVDSTREVGFWFRDDVREVRVRVELF
ncbi:hypothetical protein AJ80_09788 [Polytolypa hystricis UAMH7299]|uniref:CAP-Gly domain-containing protein n=1 Tax=Polytolypa hystricis (strain UAMH7299) TaxID=1447883 RepID=A0A2B7WJH5_POLH7|nr:hypothetical protein AJ80_09788 [Polytolypa hystricis UAMH7299]